MISELASLAFTDTAQNVVLIGGPGTGKTHLATALAVSGITRHGKRVRFYSTVDLVNLLEREKHDDKAGRIAQALLRMDLVILDELGRGTSTFDGVAIAHSVVEKLTEDLATKLREEVESARRGEQEEHEARLNRVLQEMAGLGEKIAENFWVPAFGGAIEDWFAYMLALVFLLFRPQGLFGRKPT